MPTINQLIRKSRKVQVKKKKNVALEQCPQRRGVCLLLSAVHAQPLIVLERSGTLERIGAENLFADFPAALAGARRIVGEGAGGHDGPPSR